MNGARVPEGVEMSRDLRACIVLVRCDVMHVQDSSRFIGLRIGQTHPLFHGFLCIWAFVDVKGWRVHKNYVVLHSFETEPHHVNHRGAGSPAVVRPEMNLPTLQKSIQKSTLSRVSRTYNEHYDVRG